MVLVEVRLCLVHVLPEALLLELAVVGGGADEVGGRAGDPALVDLVRLVGQGGLGRLGYQLGAGEQFAGGLGRVVLVLLAGIAGVRIRLH